MIFFKCSPHHFGVDTDLFRRGHLRNRFFFFLALFLFFFLIFASVLPELREYEHDHQKNYHQYNNDDTFKAVHGDQYEPDVGDHDRNLRYGIAKDHFLLRAIGIRSADGLELSVRRIRFDYDIGIGGGIIFLQDHVSRLDVKYINIVGVSHRSERQVRLHRSRVYDRRLHACQRGNQNRHRYQYRRDKEHIYDQFQKL